MPSELALQDFIAVISGTLDKWIELGLGDVTIRQIREELRKLDIGDVETLL